MKTIKLKQETFDGYMTKIDNLKRELAVVTGERANTIKQSQENSVYYKGEIKSINDKLNSLSLGLVKESNRCAKYEGLSALLFIVSLVSIATNFMQQFNTVSGVTVQIYQSVNISFNQGDCMQGLTVQEYLDNTRYSTEGKLVEFNGGKYYLGITINGQSALYLDIADDQVQLYADATDITFLQD